MGLTAWKSLTSGTVKGKPAKGLIADLPASCFQYKVAEDMEVRFSEFGLGAYDLLDKWELHIYSHFIPAPDPLPPNPTPEQRAAYDAAMLAYHDERSASLLFRQVASVDNFVTALDTGVIFFTWWWVYNTIETTRFNGVDMLYTTLAADVDGQQTGIPVTDASEWPAVGEFYMGATGAGNTYKGLLERAGYTAKTRNPDGTWTLTCSEPYQKPDGTTGARSLRGLLGRAKAAHKKGDKAQQAPGIYLGIDDGNAVPGGGSDYTDQWGIMQYDWTSPVYDMTLPAGACMEFAGHWLGKVSQGFNLDIIQTRVCAGDTFAAHYMPETGFWWLAEAGAAGVRVQVVQDVRAAGMGASPDAAAPNSGLAYPTVQRAFDGYTVTASTCDTPILLRPPNSLRPDLIYHKGAGSYLEHAIAGGEWRDPVLLTSHTIVAAGYDESGTLYALAVNGGHTNIIRRANGPITGQEFYGPGEGDEQEAFLQTGDPTNPLAAFSLVARTHRLEMRSSGNGSLVTADGKYYMTTDGGETWIG